MHSTRKQKSSDLQCSKDVLKTDYDIFVNIFLDTWNQGRKQIYIIS